MALDVPHPEITLCGQCNATFTPPAILQSVPDFATHIIRTNHMPLESEKHQIAELQREAEVHLARYSDELSRLRAVAAELEAQHAKLQQIVDGYKCVKAPIRRIPNELLDDIFSRGEWSVERDYNYHGKASTVGLNPLEKAVGLSPLCLSRVCAWWRSILLSSHHLWTHFPLTLRDTQSNPSQGRDASCATVLDTYLRRSGRLPLCITVTAAPNLRLASVVTDSDSNWSEPSYDTDTFDYYYHRHPLLSILVQHSHRWSEAELWLDSQYFADEEVLADVRGNLPLLEVLKLYGEPLALFGEPMQTAYGDFFDMCPKLYRLEIYLSPDGEAKFEVPWNQLTHVNIYIRQVEKVLKIFQLCPNLSRFDFVSYISKGNNLAPISSNLESLSIDLHAERDVDSLREGVLARFFEALTLPHLKVLDVAATGFAWPHSAFTSFLRRLSCPLRELSVSVQGSEPNGDLVEILECVPDLHSLKVNTYTVTDSLIHSLTYFPADAGRGSPLLPRLTFLELDFPRTISSSVLDMIESRWAQTAEYSSGSSGAVARLESVVACSRRYREEHWRVESTSLVHLRQMRPVLLLPRKVVVDTDGEDSS